MKRSSKGILHRHSLSLSALAVVVALILLYNISDERTHWGSFFGNAIADWTGVLVTIVATKFLYEKGSAESKPIAGPDWLHLEWCREHSLTIFLLLTGAVWVLAFHRMNPNGKWGQVVGNIVSEWTQILGLVLLTKRLIEIGSKERKGR